MDAVAISTQGLGWLCGTIGFLCGFLIGMFLVAAAWSSSDECKKEDTSHA